MGAFDPDAYLAKPVAFDPDAYLAKGSNEVPSATPTRQPDAIPSERAPSRGALDYIAGIPETAVTAGFGMLKGAVAPFAAVAGELLGGVNTPQGRAQGARFGKNVESALTYTPQTQTAKDIINYASEKLQGVDFNAIPFAQGATAVAMAPAAARQLPSAIKNEVGYLKSAAGEIPLVKQIQESRVAESYARAPQIEAANLAQKYGIALDPAASNPSARNRVRTGLIGSADLDDRLSKANKPKWTEIVKKDLGLGDEVSLNNAKVFDDIRARDDISGPYKVVQEIPSIRVPEGALQKLDDLQVTPLFGDTGQAAATNAYLNNLKTQLAEGGSGGKLLKSIQQMRQEAQNVIRTEKAGNPVTPAARAEANAKMNAARVLEELIDENIPTLSARNKFIKARQKMAQTYDIEAATDFGTGQIDPKAFAKLVSEGKPVSGVIADIGKIVSNFPEIAALTSEGKKLLPSFTRAGPGGALGGIIGSAFGGIGAPVGAVIGAGTSDIIRRVAANRMTSPEFQASRAVPKDYRPPINNLRPVEPGQSNVVPFDPRNNPNFIFPTGETTRVPFDPNRPDARLPPMLGQSGPAPAPANALRLGVNNYESLQELKARERLMAQSAEARALSAEKQNFVRTPTKGEVILDVDPITGKLLPQTSQGLKGATLETFQDYTSTLRSAIDKLSSKSTTFEPTDTQKFRTGRFDETGKPIYAYRQTSLTPVVEKGNRAFDLTAAEKVAFDKTKFYIAEVSPGFEKLSDKAIVSRMMDRKWVEDAVVQAREKSLALDQAAIRSRSPEMIDARASAAQNAELARRAEEASLQMKSTLDLLEDRLVKLRADTSGKRQGPKTQGAIRNNLTANQNRNKLRED
jgi:hypothetical protein